MKKISFGSLAALVLGVALASSAHAATTVIVTPDNTQGWSTADTRPGGAVNFVSDPTSPYPPGALELMTSSSTAAKAQYMYAFSTTSATTTMLSAVNDLSYSSRVLSGPSYANASYQLVVDLNGTSTGGFTTFVYEPYQQTGATTTATSTWMMHDVDAGQFWSSRSFSEGTCTVTAGAGGAPFYTLADLKANCPNATVLAFGVNVGSNNPDYDIYVDGVTFNGTTYDFEMTPPTPPVTAPLSKDECKDGGWKMFNPAFKNQGDCVSFVATGGKNPPAGAMSSTTPNGTTTDMGPGHGNNKNK